MAIMLLPSNLRAIRIKRKFLVGIFPFNLNIFYILGTLNIVPNELVLSDKFRARIITSYSKDLPTVGTLWSLEGHALADTLYTVTCKFSKKKLLVAGRRIYTAKEWATVLLRT
ncbi:hypothetical protein MYCTH_91077 [Thermothelomyces thermophilus ATCC 42464]|uniref:Uncharacterized protein n=1 Tax=Thermothelomyces thermophilus (strain ATCC 42464 / BCRC 31852 / DSM 1799) TaxID=573729 RepID=G2Q3K7_THET4|nr:uncharacterized protein MYCTH_91077 [Thermothelomyces thermophilus ATCC 42464]AEO53563.1 hypothetical protein MYCTH_91077 [Thermothelomyces thermophilus ATCC 42464]